MNKIVFLILIYLGGCNVNESLNDDFLGQWKYQNSQNEYAEIWFDSKYVLMLDETTYNIDVYNYDVKKDSIILYSIYGGEPIFSVNYQQVNRNKYIFTNEFISVTIERFGKKAIIDTSMVFKENIYKGFEERLSTH